MALVSMILFLKFLKSLYHCPLRFYLKMLCLKCSEFCVQVDFPPSLLDSAFLILAGVSYTHTPVRPYKPKFFVKGEIF